MEKKINILSTVDLRMVGSKFNDLSSKINKNEINNSTSSNTQDEDLINNNKKDQILSLQVISDLLDTVIRDLEKVRINKDIEERLNDEDSSAQKSFL